MIFRKQTAEIERLKQQIYAQDQHIRTQNTELKYLRSTDDLNITWKSACDQKDEIIKHQQQELERLGSTIDAAKQLHIENKKLYKDLHMQELEIKRLLKNDASDFGWKVVADERNEVIKDQKQDIKNMKCRIDAAKDLEISHQSLQADYEHLQQNHNKMREEKTKSDRKINDLEARLNATTFAPAKPIPPLPRHPLHMEVTARRGDFSLGGAQGAWDAIPQDQRTVHDVLAHVSNGGDLPPIVIGYLRSQFSHCAASLCRLDEAHFNEVVTGGASGNICIQQKAINAPATVFEVRKGACDLCIGSRRICLQKKLFQSVVVVPLPVMLRLGKRVEELDYWVLAH